MTLSHSTVSLCKEWERGNFGTRVMCRLFQLKVMAITKAMFWVEYKQAIRRPECVIAGCNVEGDMVQ